MNEFFKPFFRFIMAFGALFILCGLGGATFTVWGFSDKPGVAPFYMIPVIFTLVGSGMMYGAWYGQQFFKRKAENKDWLLQSGRRIEVKVTHIGQMPNLRVNGKSPWQIEAEWLNVSDNTLYHYKSEYLWFDPQEYMEGKESVWVMVNPANPSEYAMDISFLPKYREAN